MINPIHLIETQMFLRGLTQADIARTIGTTSGTVHKMLNFQRKLSVVAIRRLNEAYGIPLKMLVQDYPLFNKPTK